MQMFSVSFLAGPARWGAGFAPASIRCLPTLKCAVGICDGDDPHKERVLFFRLISGIKRGISLGKSQIDVQ
jgi:hypothetical protein